MAETFHCCLSVRGALRWPGSKLRGMLRNEQGHALSADEVREWLMDQLAAGREVVPFGAACDGFDYKTGCPGHSDLTASPLAKAAVNSGNASSPLSESVPHVER
jgi:hypothetical protein